MASPCHSIGRVAVPKRYSLAAPLAEVLRSAAPGDHHHWPVREMSRDARTPSGAAAFPRGGVGCSGPRLHAHERAGDRLQVLLSASGRGSGAIFVPMLNSPRGPGGAQCICWCSRRFAWRRRTPIHASCLRFVPLVDLDRSRNLARNPCGRSPRCLTGLAAAARRWPAGRRHLVVISHHDIPPARAGRQDSEIPHQVGARWRHQSGQASHQIERVEDDVGGAGALAVAEAIEDPAIGGLGEGVAGDRRPPYVSAICKPPSYMDLRELLFVVLTGWRVWGRA
jgi:hypothetical protein